MKELVEGADLYFYANLDDKMEIAKIKEGTAPRGWMVVRNKNSDFFAGYAMMIIVKVVGPGQYDIRTQPTMLCDETGQQYGVLRSVTLPVKASTSGQSPNGKGK